MDRKPIKLAFGLLVPAQANEQHLKILAHLAHLFGNDMLRTQLFCAQSNHDVFELLTTWSE